MIAEQEVGTKHDHYTEYEGSGRSTQNVSGYWRCVDPGCKYRNTYDCDKCLKCFHPKPKMNYRKRQGKQWLSRPRPTETVWLTYVENPTRFFAQTKEQRRDAEKMSKILNENYSKTITRVKEVVNGMMCAMKTEKGWVRVRVRTTNCKEPDCPMQLQARSKDKNSAESKDKNSTDVPVTEVFGELPNKTSETLENHCSGDLDGKAKSNEKSTGTDYSEKEKGSPDSKNFDPEIVTVGDFKLKEDDEQNPCDHRNEEADTKGFGGNEGTLNEDPVGVAENGAIGSSEASGNILDTQENVDATVPESEESSEVVIVEGDEGRNLIQSGEKSLDKTLNCAEEYKEELDRENKVNAERVCQESNCTDALSNSESDVAKRDDKKPLLEDPNKDSNESAKDLDTRRSIVINDNDCPNKNEKLAHVSGLAESLEQATYHHVEVIDNGNWSCVPQDSLALVERDFDSISPLVGYYIMSGITSKAKGPLVDEGCKWLEMTLADNPLHIEYYGSGRQSYTYVELCVGNLYVNQAVVDKGFGSIIPGYEKRLRAMVRKVNAKHGSVPKLEKPVSISVHENLTNGVTPESLFHEANDMKQKLKQSTSTLAKAPTKMQKSHSSKDEDILGATCSSHKQNTGGGFPDYSNASAVHSTAGLGGWTSYSSTWDPFVAVEELKGSLRAYKKEVDRLSQHSANNLLLSTMKLVSDRAITRQLLQEMIDADSPAMHGLMPDCEESFSSLSTNVVKLTNQPWTTPVGCKELGAIKKLAQAMQKMDDDEKATSLLMLVRKARGSVDRGHLMMGQEDANPLDDSRPLMVYQDWKVVYEETEQELAASVEALAKVFIEYGEAIRATLKGESLRDVCMWTDEVKKLTAIMSKEEALLKQGTYLMNAAKHNIVSEVGGHVAMGNKKMTEDPCIAKHQEVVQREQKISVDTELLTLTKFVSNSKDDLPLDTLEMLMQDVIGELARYHERNEAYGYLHPDNITIIEGSAQLRPVQCAVKKNYSLEVAWSFDCPEIFTLPGDIYSLGQVILWLLCRTLEDTQEVKKKVEWAFTRCPDLNALVSNSVADRPTLKSLYQQRWFTDVQRDDLNMDMRMASQGGSICETERADILTEEELIMKEMEDSDRESLTSKDVFLDADDDRQGMLSDDNNVLVACDEEEKAVMKESQDTDEETFDSAEECRRNSVTSKECNFDVKLQEEILKKVQDTEGGSDGFELHDFVDGEKTKVSEDVVKSETGSPVDGSGGGKLPESI